MIPLCRDQGVGVIPYSPLARGVLAGNRARDGRPATVRAGTDPLAESRHDETDFEIIDVVRAIAGERGLAPAQVSLAWLFGRPGVTAPVVGATKPHHVDAAVAALEVTLTEEEVARLEAPYRPHPVIGHS